MNVQFETWPRLRSSVVCMLLVVGVFFPTSFGGNYSVTLMGIGYVLCIVLLGMLWLTSGRVVSNLQLVVCLSIVPVLLFFTFVSRLSSYTPGVLGPYAVMSVLFITDIADIELSTSVKRIYLLVNLTILAICFGILLGNDQVRRFIEGYYSAFYPDLVPNMLFFRKPVLTFATHSLAAFFLYLFFYINFRSYLVHRRWFDLVLALCYLGLTIALFSVTGLILALVATAQLIAKVKVLSAARVWVFVGGVTSCVFLLFALNLVPFGKLIRVELGDVFNVASSILTSQQNGFLGRWGGEGVLHDDIRFLSNNPLAPIGISHRPELNFVDCGMLEHFLRGSVPLCLIIYTSFYSFLRRNVRFRPDLACLLGVILAFEIGFSSLTYFRTPYLLCFFIVYLNGLDKNRVGLPQEV